MEELKEDLIAYRKEIFKNIDCILAEVETDPIHENYKSKNLLNYLSCLNLIQRMMKERGD